MVFGLSPLTSATIIFTNSVIGKAYMTSVWRKDPDGCPGNPKFDNDRKAQLNEAEWAPLIISGLLCLHIKGESGPTIAAGLVAAGQVWYFWTRVLLFLKNGTPTVLPGGVMRYVGSIMLSVQLVRSLTAARLR